MKKKTVALALLGWLFWSVLPAWADSPQIHFLAFETLPAACPALRGAPCRSPASYDAREKQAHAARARIVPLVLGAAETAPGRAEISLTHGGYLGRTNPALILALEGSHAEARQLAAMLGYVFAQESVLVWTWAEEGAAAAVIRFPAGTLTPETGQSFFAAAARRHEGLGGGYTALGDEMVFLNLRGPDGVPFSGLDDAAFAHELRKAAEAFTQAPASAGRTGRVRAILVSNDWVAAPEGEDYLSRIADPSAALKLRSLKAGPVHGRLPAE